MANQMVDVSMDDTLPPVPGPLPFSQFKWTGPLAKEQSPPPTLLSRFNLSMEQVTGAAQDEAFLASFVMPPVGTYLANSVQDELTKDGDVKPKTDAPNAPGPIAQTESNIPYALNTTTNSPEQALFEPNGLLEPVTPDFTYPETPTSGSTANPPQSPKAISFNELPRISHKGSPEIIQDANGSAPSSTLNSLPSLTVPALDFLISVQSSLSSAQTTSAEFGIRTQSILASTSQSAIETATAQNHFRRAAEASQQAQAAATILADEAKASRARMEEMEKLVASGIQAMKDELQSRTEALERIHKPGEREAALISERDEWRQKCRVLEEQLRATKAESLLQTRGADLIAPDGSFYTHGHGLRTTSIDPDWLNMPGVERWSKIQSTLRPRLLDDPSNTQFIWEWHKSQVTPQTAGVAVDESDVAMDLPTSHGLVQEDRDVTQPRESNSGHAETQPSTSDDVAMPSDVTITQQASTIEDNRTMIDEGAEKERKAQYEAKRAEVMRQKRIAMEEEKSNIKASRDAVAPIASLIKRSGSSQLSVSRTDSPLSDLTSLSGEDFFEDVKLSSWVPDFDSNMFVKAPKPTKESFVMSLRHLGLDFGIPTSELLGDIQPLPSKKQPLGAPNGVEALRRSPRRKSGDPKQTEEFNVLVDDEGIPLPLNFERRLDSKGRTYYLDHTNRTTSWYRPQNVPLAEVPSATDKRILEETESTTNIVEAQRTTDTPRSQIAEAERSTNQDPFRRRSSNEHRDAPEHSRGKSPGPVSPSLQTNDQGFMEPRQTNLSPVGGRSPSTPSDDLVSRRSASPVASASDPDFENAGPRRRHSSSASMPASKSVDPLIGGDRYSPEPLPIGRGRDVRSPTLMRRRTPSSRSPPRRVDRYSPSTSPPPRRERYSASRSPPRRRLSPARTPSPPRSASYRDVSYPIQRPPRLLTPERSLYARLDPSNNHGLPGADTYSPGHPMLDLKRRRDPDDDPLHRVPSYGSPRLESNSDRSDPPPSVRGTAFRGRGGSGGRRPSRGSARRGAFGRGAPPSSSSTLMSRMETRTSLGDRLS